MLYNLVRGPQVCQLFSCYVSPSINKVLTYLLTYLPNSEETNPFDLIWDFLVTAVFLLFLPSELK